MKNKIKSNQNGWNQMMKQKEFMLKILIESHKSKRAWTFEQGSQQKKKTNRDNGKIAFHLFASVNVVEIMKIYLHLNEITHIIQTVWKPHDVIAILKWSMWHHGKTEFKMLNATQSKKKRMEYHTKFNV